MKLKEISPDIKIKIDLVLIENNVAWFESYDAEFTFDLPVRYDTNGKEFEFTKTCETYWCFNEDVGYHVVSKDGNKVLVLMLESKEDGYEIQNGYIYNIVQTH